MLYYRMFWDHHFLSNPGRYFLLQLTRYYRSALRLIQGKRKLENTRNYRSLQILRKAHGSLVMSEYPVSVLQPAMYNQTKAIPAIHSYP